jgi:hypothetical protein
MIVPIIAASASSPIIAASASSPAQDHSAFPKMMRRKSVNDKQSLWMKKLQEQKDGQKGVGGADQKRAGRDDAAHSPGTAAAAKRSPISSLWLNTIKSSAEQRRESYSSAPLTISEIRAEGEGQGGGTGMMTLSPDAPHSSSIQPDPQEQQQQQTSASSTSSTTTEASTTVTNTAS